MKMSRVNKKYSLLFINNDVRTHAAFKNALNTITGAKSTKGGENPNLKSAYMEFKNNQRYPIGLSEQRFLWQNSNYKHCKANSIELNGSLSIKRTIKNSFDGGFESFYDITQELPIDKNRNSSTKVNRSTRKKIMENLNSGRVINPKLDKTFGGRIEDIPKGRKAEFNDDKKSHTLGSISNLIAKTPDSTFSGGRKRVNVSFESGINIFSKHFQMTSEPYVRTKKLVQVPNSNSKNKCVGIRTSSTTQSNLKNSVPTRSKNTSQKMFYSGLNISKLSEYNNKNTKNVSSLNKTTVNTTFQTINKKQINTINYSNGHTISSRKYNPPNNNSRIKYTKNQKSLNNHSSYMGDRSTKSNMNDLSRDNIR